MSEQPQNTSSKHSIDSKIAPVSFPGSENGDKILTVKPDGKVVADMYNPQHFDKNRARYPERFEQVDSYTAIGLDLTYRRSVKLAQGSMTV